MSAAQSISLEAVAEQLGLTVVSGQEQLAAEVSGGIVSDLLSYVMAHGRSGWLWITIQTHPNIVAVAALGQMAGILIAGGFPPEEDTVARAEEEQIPLLTSEAPAYDLAGRLYALGVR